VPTKYARLDGEAIHYLHTGTTSLPGVPPPLDRGALFAFAHAAGSNAGMWRRQLDGLSARHSAVAVDLPGHGRSTGLEGPPTVEAGADVVGRFLDVVCSRPCVLVGRSMGGAIALVLAARRVPAVRALVLACTSARFALPPGGIEAVRDVVRGRLPQQFTTETFSPASSLDLMKEAWMEQVKTDPRVRLTDLLACQAFDGRALLARIQMPVLVVAGADDQVTPVAESTALADGIPGARLEVIPQAGHQAPLEQSATFNRLLEEFAEGLG
jgi:pimeloyl-ACP methyl ester carboxylesterase